MKMIQILLMFGIFCALTRASISVDVEGMVEDIEKRYGDIKDISGTFYQKSFLKDLDRVEDYAGRFFIKKPSKMRWDYSGKRDEQVIINGESIWIYKKSERQLLRGIFKKGRYSHLPLALLQGIGDIKRDFYIRTTGDNTLELTPKTEMGVIKKIELLIGNKFPVREFTITDNYENKVTIRIDNVVINTDISESLFTFKPPPQTEVIDLN